MTQEQNPKVGIGVMIVRDGKVLLAKRKGSHGADQYAFPGGHLEHGESFAECAVRETMEEAGIVIDNIRFLLVANVMTYMPKHYVHLTLLADWVSGVPEIREPDKCQGWDWYDLDHLPEPLFDMCRLSFDSYKSGKIYYDNETLI